MGVPSLGKVLKECPDAWEEVPDEKLAEKFSGKTFLFDAPAMMHRFVNKCDTIVNNEHLACFLHLRDRMRKCGIECAFMFDGKQTMAKHDEVVRRVESKQRSMAKAQQKVTSYQKELNELQEKIQQSPPEFVQKPASSPKEQVEQVAKVEQEAKPELDFAAMARLSTLKGLLVEQTKRAERRVRGSYYTDLKEIFRREGIPFMTANYEAEQAGAWLVKHGLADVIVSDDYDCLVCGAPFFFQHFHSSKRAQRLIHLEPLMQHLGFTEHSQFVDYCILSGTDFPGRLPGIGPVNAQRLIKKHGSIEALLASADGKRFQSADGAKPTAHRVAQRMFLDDAFPLSSVEIPASATAFSAIRDRFEAQLEQPVNKSPVKRIVRLSNPDVAKLKPRARPQGSPERTCDSGLQPKTPHKKSRLINI
uniref:XPG-I domain-containing protein n=1 Tax=viral metagenome TaxID=1070528 RepID=A0A6C0BMF0_9ZZZZ